MEFKTTLEIVTRDLQDIEKLVGNFKNYQKIPNIELDLALSRLRNVYDLLLMFREESGSLSEQQVSVTPIENIERKEHPEEAVKEVPKPQSTQKFISEAVKVPETVKPSSDVVSVNPDPEKKLTADKKVINEKLAGDTVKKDVSSKLQGQPIKSIAGSIGINDKFLFIRELFAGDSEAFRSTMSELDELRNFNEAHTLLMTRFQWDMDSEPVQMLLNLIRRKYITSGNE